ncbi:alginate lyase family protein [Sphingomonas sp. DG1-23]|uniref:heparinase II/III family protein n=1 Tax=Sphingomonas sp. DG1-23 TaxID=3068316 RepID=UPI00273E4705|nr:alginate lyase family protein [Sphingomonas sp. DG1-23]MDP5280673.1 alginate lyase family protein [Sphingomonas sp. DG1-23]
MNARKFSLYWHTLRHLRPVQLWGRLHRLLVRPAVPAPERLPVRSVTGALVAWAERRPSMIGPSRFRFLNDERTAASPETWADPAVPLLWLYNLHYFDDLAASGATARGAWHAALIQRWLSEHPAPAKPGWDPYPTSLRIVNWIKYILAVGVPDPAIVASLAQQARWLSKDVEWHLLANHLFANAKALLFAGAFFEGPEADRLLGAAERILTVQLPEQVLPDGGHFERSPMYHAIILEDVLDMLNAARLWRGAVSPRLERMLDETAGRMLGAMARMCHPDGEIGFFNDSATGIAANPGDLAAYAARLGVVASDHSQVWPGPDVKLGGALLADTGYARLTAPAAVAIVDVAPVGPDYQPGHAHADTLSFELSVFGSRLIVNGGTSCYGLGPDRAAERRTSAHSTVSVDGQDSSEIWSGFRVARRAYPRDLVLSGNSEEVGIACSHDGYRRLARDLAHRRSWRMRAQALTIEDRILGEAGHSAVAQFKLHPDVTAIQTDARNFVLQLATGHEVRLIVHEGAAVLAGGHYAPEFGRRLETDCIAVQLVEGRSRVELSWQA